jgi:hypothetical protein
MMMENKRCSGPVPAFHCNVQEECCQNSFAFDDTDPYEPFGKLMQPSAGCKSNWKNAKELSESDSFAESHLHFDNPGPNESKPMAHAEYNRNNAKTVTAP